MALAFSALRVRQSGLGGCVMTDYASDTEGLIREWADAWSKHDTERLLALFTDDVEYEDVTFGVVNHGKEELRAFAEGFYVVSPDMTFDLTSTTIAGDRAAMEWVASGTHAGDLPGMPATGKRYEFRGATVVELAGGKIRRNADYWDFATLMRQLGFLSAPE
jgi:steroid delta-isomerase-like uncharacterized protein